MPRCNVHNKLIITPTTANRRTKGTPSFDFYGLSPRRRGQ